MVVRRSDELRLRVRSLNRGLFKRPLLRHRHCDGYVACMHQAGSHWVRYMLSLTLARLYDLPPLAHIRDLSIVGIQGRPIYSHIPQIAISHSIPHYLQRSRMLFRILHFPRYVVLVRDVRDALVSHYEKHKGRFNVDFSTCLRGDVRGQKYGYDIWVRIRFLNAWGAMVERHPKHVAVLKYEELLSNTQGQLARVCDYFNIEGVTPDLLDEVVAAASKTEMAKRLNPNRKKNRSVVRMDARPAKEWYTDEDLRFVAELCRRNLKHTFGYPYW